MRVKSFSPENARARIRDEMSGGHAPKNPPGLLSSLSAKAHSSAPMMLGYQW
jgi:hypothetical protein